MNLFENLQIMKEAENWQAEYQSYVDSNKYDIDQLSLIKNGLYNKLDVSTYDNPQFTYFQMLQIYSGLKKGLDISIYADLKFDGDQMREIRQGLESKVDVSKYANPTLTDNEMKKIRRSLERDMKNNNNNNNNNNTQVINDKKVVPAVSNKTLSRLDYLKTQVDITRILDKYETSSFNEYVVDSHGDVSTYRVYGQYPRFKVAIH